MDYNNINHIVSELESLARDSNDPEASIDVGTWLPTAVDALKKWLETLPKEISKYDPKGPGA